MNFFEVAQPREVTQADAAPDPGADTGRYAAAMGDDDRPRDPDELRPEEASTVPGDDAPPLPDAVSVAVTGVLCGFVMVGFVWLAERGCDVARGTPNCGGWGLPLLVLAVVTTIVAGVVMLRRLRHPNAGLIAFLGVCFMLIAVLGAFSNRLFTAWTVLVLPTLTAVTFLLARAVVARLKENA
jgi:hypothetical protein